MCSNLFSDLGVTATEYCFETEHEPIVETCVSIIFVAHGYVTSIFWSGHGFMHC